MGKKLRTISLKEVADMAEPDHAYTERNDNRDGLHDALEASLERQLGIEANAKNQAVEITAASTARDKVLGLNEILTNILVHLPPKNIFGVQRVSKSFLNAVQKSPEIREKLFLRQRKIIKSVSVEGGEPAKLTINPLLLRGNMKLEGFGIKNISAVNIQSSILDTYPLDVPCGEIVFVLEVRDHVGRDGRWTLVETIIVDTGKTLRGLLEPLLRRRLGWILVDDGRCGHWRRECSPHEVIDEWQVPRTKCYFEVRIYLQDPDLKDRVIGPEKDEESEDDDERY